MPQKKQSATTQGTVVIGLGTANSNESVTRKSQEEPDQNS